MNFLFNLTATSLPLLDLNVSASVFRRREDADQRQVPGGLHRPPAAGAGEGVSLQQVHHHPQEGGARHGAQPVRETGALTHCSPVR